MLGYEEGITCRFVKSDRVPPQFCMACVHRENWRHDDKAVVSEAAKLMWMKSPVTRLTRGGTHKRLVIVCPFYI